MPTLDVLGIGPIPLNGQGTWHMGEVASQRKQEEEALRTGIALGLTMVDTAEMYGNGATERFVGEALEGLRNQVILVRVRTH